MIPAQHLRGTLLCFIKAQSAHTKGSGKEWGSTEGRETWLLDWGHTLLGGTLKPEQLMDRCPLAAG